MLKYDIIPVVFGGGPYDSHVPKSAYINAFDFDSPKDLTLYMKKVADNSILYNSYFQWKRFVKRISYPNVACDLCIMLNLEDHFGIEHSVVDFNKFWNKTKDCKRLNPMTFKLESL